MGEVRLDKLYNSENGQEGGSAAAFIAEVHVGGRSGVLEKILCVWLGCRSVLVCMPGA